MGEWVTSAPAIKGDWSAVQSGATKEAYSAGYYGVYYTAKVSCAVTTDNKLCVRITVQHSRSFGSVGTAWVYKARVIDSDGTHESETASIVIGVAYTWYWVTQTNTDASVTAGLASAFASGGGWSEVVLAVPALGDQFLVKVAGVWKQGQALIKVSGAWVSANGKVKTGGVWK